MAKPAKLKPEILLKLQDILTEDEIVNLDQSQVYLLSIAPLNKLVLEGSVNIADLAKDNDLCFIRLQAFLNGDIVQLVQKKKITLQALSAINHDTVEIILRKFDEILKDDDNKILLNILIHETPVLWDRNVEKHPISPWNAKKWDKYKVQMPDLVKILDFSALELDTPLLSTPEHYKSSELLPTFAELIEEFMTPKEATTRQKTEVDAHDDSPFGRTYDAKQDKEIYYECSESMMSTSSPLPVMTRHPKMLDLNDLIEIHDDKPPTHPRMNGDTLHYFNRVRVKIPEDYNFLTEGQTLSAPRQ